MSAQLNIGGLRKNLSFLLVEEMQTSPILALYNIVFISYTTSFPRLNLCNCRVRRK